MSSWNKPFRLGKRLELYECHRPFIYGGMLCYLIIGFIVGDQVHRVPVEAIESWRRLFTSILSIFGG